MQGMETAYVGNRVSASEASTTVGTEVIKAVAQKYQTNNQIGKATIEIEGFGTIDNVERDATVSVYTTDFIVEGTITLNDGVLTWGEIEELTPGIKLSDSTLTIESGKTSLLTVSFKLIPNNTVVTWTSSDTTNKITVSNGTVTVDSSVANNTTATITAKVTYNGTDYTKTCIVTAKKREPIAGIVGDYIPYDVSYKDIYSNNVFTSATGWRILDAEETGTAGEYKNVKIISTGIPAKYYYYCNSNYNGTSNATISDTNVQAWWGTDEQVTDLFGSENATGFIYASSGKPNYYAATGLFKNFKYIPLNGNSSNHNTVYLASVTSGNHAITNTNYKGVEKGTTKTNDDDGCSEGSIFLTNYAEEVHNLTIEELNFARGLGSIVNYNIPPNSRDAVGTTGTGLFYLRNLNAYGYTSQIGYYWLASPHVDNTYNLRIVGSDGAFGNNWQNDRGLRPVVSLKSNIHIKKVDNEWTFIEK